MRAAPLIICLWPGLAGLWLKGRWIGLCEALAFAVLLNASLAASFVGPGRISFTLSAVVWLVVTAAWCLGAWRNFRQLPELHAASVGPAHVVDLYPEAQAEYLKGHWFEAESLLTRQLRDHPEDAESRLLLATLYRRTDRQHEARQQLKRLTQCDTSYRWQFEIEQERALLAGQNESLPSEGDPTVDPRDETPSERTPSDAPHQQNARAA